MNTPTTPGSAEVRLRDLLELEVLLDRVPLVMGSATAVDLRLTAQALLRDRIAAALADYIGQAAPQ